MKIKLIFLALLSSYFFNAQTSFNFGWANGFGSSTNEESYYSKVDGLGNVYITGKITGTVDFDPGVGTNTLDPGITQQCFLAKYSPSGSLIWAKMLGTIGVGSSQGIVIGIDPAPSYNVYITGFFDGIVDMDPGPATLSVQATGNSDLFMTKFDLNGSMVWNRTIGGLSTQINPNDMKISSTGEMVITGAFKSVVDFDASPSNYTIAAGGADEDVFVMKYDASGIFQWAIGFGQSASGDLGVGLDTDAGGNIYVSGMFENTVDFDPSVGGTATVTSNGDEDVFIAKYTSTGGYVWAGTIGGVDKDQGYRIKYNAAGELLICAQMQSLIFDADPSPATSTLGIVGTAQNNLVLGKYNANTGALIWAKNTGGNGFVGIGAYYLNSDAQNNIYLCGFFDGVTDFDFTNGTNNLTAFTVGGTDMFISKYDSQGNYLFAKNIGSPAGFANEAYCINIGPNNEVIVTGQFEGTQDFDLTPAVFNQTAVGARDFFIAKYTQCTNPTTPTLSVNTLTVCGTTNLTTLTVVGGSLNSAANWFWSTGSCGAATVAVGNIITVTPTVTTVYFVRGEGGCVLPGGVCASASITVIPLKDISGKVTTNTLSPVPVAGKVVFYKYEGGFTKYDSITYQTIDALGNYTFASAPAGNYIVMALPTATNLQTTYANSAIGWKTAAILPHGCITNAVQNINVIPLTNLGTGPGVLSGKIVEGLKYGFKGGVVVPGGPIKGAQVKCGRNPGGDAVGQSITNASGEYTLSNLPLSAAGESYFVLVDIPGLDTNGTYHKVITVGTSTFSNLDFVADSAKITPGAYVGIKKITAAKAELKVYPNPTHGIINVEVELFSETEIDIKVFTILGKEMFSCSPKIMNKKMQLDLTDLTDGIYFIKFKIGEEERTTKIILTR